MKNKIKNDEIVARGDSRVVTKADLQTVKIELKSDIRDVKAELKSDIDAVKAELKSDIKAVRTELKSDIKALRTEVKSDIKTLRQEILRVEEKVEDLEEDIKDIKANNQKMDIKLDRLQNTLDAFVGVIDDLRTDNTVGAHHTRELQERVDDHEERLKQIESAKHAV